MICSSDSALVRGAFECDESDHAASIDPAAVARALRKRARAERSTLREIDVGAR